MADTMTSTKNKLSVSFIYIHPLYNHKSIHICCYPLVLNNLLVYLQVNQNFLTSSLNSDGDIIEV